MNAVEEKKRAEFKEQVDSGQVKEVVTTEGKRKRLMYVCNNAFSYHNKRKK